MTSEDIEVLAEVAFNAYADRMTSAVTLRMKTPIAEWAEQHAEVRASWCVATAAVVREVSARILVESQEAVSCDECRAEYKISVHDHDPPSMCPECTKVADAEEIDLLNHAADPER